MNNKKVEGQQYPMDNFLTKDISIEEISFGGSGVFVRGLINLVIQQKTGGLACDRFIDKAFTPFPQVLFTGISVIFL